jgi:formylglycine-generating enzyme required for sulfatase activity
MYRLPSEAEWEHACRAGTPTPFFFGGTILAEQANYDAIVPYVSRQQQLRQTVSVERYKPNAFGLFQMHGNVYE